MNCRTTETMSIISRDGHKLIGKLDLPAQTPVSRLVVFVNGSGPNTCDNKRDKGDGSCFNFYDLLAKELTDRGIGFFRYSTRGCTERDQPPFYCTIDWEEYGTYNPGTCVADIEDGSHISISIPAAGHSLDYEKWLYGEGLPQGLRDLFRVCETL